MPAAIPLLAAAAAASYGVGAVATALITGAASAVVAGYQADRARKKASRQRSEALANQTVLVRSATVDRRVVYGRAMLSGPIAFAESTGTANNTLHLVVPLCEGPIDAIEEVYLNEKPVQLAAFDANGHPTTGPFVQTRRDEGAITAVPDASGNWTATIPSSATIVSVTAYDPGYVNDGWTLAGPTNTAYTRPNSTTVTGTGVTGNRIVEVAYTVDVAVGDARLKIRVFTGSDSQVASQDLIDAVPAKWTLNHRLRGIAYLYVRLTRDEAMFPTGLPNIKARVRGKLVLDPRDGVTRWSDSWALCVLDYLVTYCGAASADIDSAKMIAAANKSDELVLSAGRPAAADYGVTALTRNVGSEPRYTLNGAIGLSESPQAVLERMMSQGVGLLTWTEGTWQIRAGAYESPDPLAYFDEGDLIGPLSVQPRRKRSELFNAARARFISAEQGYIEYDATPYRSALYKAQDNNQELFADFELPLCRTNSEAQRLLRATLQLARRQMTAEATVSIARGLIPQAGDTVALTSSRHGFADKVFRVLRWDWAAPNAVRLTLREEDNGWDSWSSIDAAETPPPSASSLPDPFTRPTLTGLDLQSGPAYARRRPDGVIVQGARISWTASTNPTVLRGGRIEVQYRVASDTSWTSAESVAGDATSILIDQVTPEIVYVVRARAITSIGVPGVWSYHSEAIVGPASTFQTTGYLTNESVTLAADSSGTVASFAPAAGAFKAFASLTDITELCTFSVVSSSGVTISISNAAGTRGQYTVSAMSADTGTATLRAVYGAATLDKVFSVSKSRAGVSSFAYWIAGAAAFGRSAANVYTPASITLTAYRSGAGGVPETYAGRWKVDTSTDGVTFTNNAATASDSATTTYTPSGGTLKAVRVRLLVAGGGGQVLDEVVLPVVLDGAAGGDGLSAITPILSNAAHTLPADSAGTVSSYVGSGTLIQLYEGTTALTYVSSLTGASQFTIGTPVVSPAGQITVGARSGAGTTAATVAQHSAMGAGTDTLTITYPVTVRRASGTDSTLNLVQTLTKSKGGANAQVLTLTATAQAFTFGGDDQPRPTSQTITFVANLQNLTGVATFTCTLYSPLNASLGTVTLGGAGTNTRTLTVAQFGNAAAYAVVTAALSGFSDTVTVIALEDGKDGVGGKNLLSNTSMPYSAAGWDLAKDGAGAAANVSGGWVNSSGLAPTYHPVNAGAFYIYEAGVRPGNGVTESFVANFANRVPVSPGERLEGSAYINTHRCTLALTVSFYNASGAYIGETILQGPLQVTEQQLQTLDKWTRVGGFVTVPAGAATALIFVRKYGGVAGSTNSYVFVTMFYLGRANATQSELSPWSDGTLRHVDSLDLTAESATTFVEYLPAGGSVTAAAGQFSAVILDALVKNPKPHAIQVGVSLNVRARAVANAFAGDRGEFHITLAPANYMASQEYGFVLAPVANAVVDMTITVAKTFTIGANTTETVRVRAERLNQLASLEWYSPKVRVEVIKA